MQNAARVLPGDGGSGLHLGPGDLRVPARALAPLGHEVVDAALAVLVAGVPVLHRGVLDLGVIEGNQLHHRGVELILVAHGRGASLQITYVAAGVGDDQRTLELAGLGRVDAEIGRQLHGAAHALGDVAERPVAEDRRVERCEEVVAVGHHRAQVLPHQLGMLPHRLGERAEDDAEVRQLVLEGRRHRHAVEHRIHRHAGQHLALVQRYPQLLVGGQQFRVHLIQALGTIRRLGSRIIDDVLVVDGRIVHVGPLGLGLGLFELRPVAVGPQAPVQQPLRLTLLLGDQPDHVLAQAGRYVVRLDVGDEAVLVLAADQLVVQFHGSPFLALEKGLQESAFNVQTQLCRPFNRPLRPSRSAMLPMETPARYSASSPCALSHTEICVHTAS